MCYDRECCLLYKKELDKYLGEYATTIVMDTNNDKEDRYKEWRRDRDEEAKVLDNFRDPRHPLKLVIVTSKLLTGFDAPILQVMYLDKPMKDHTLLQAICRTNRVYGQDKTNGLIVDYIGIFDDVAKALDFDEKSIEKVITNIEEVKHKFPGLIHKCLEYFIGVDRTVEGWEGLMAAQQCLPTNKEKDAFGADYRVVNRAYNALSPDPFLDSFRFDYKWLSKVYESIKPVDTRGPMIWASVGAKTLELVHENIDVMGVHEAAEEDILELDAGQATHEPIRNGRQLIGGVCHQLRKRHARREQRAHHNTRKHRHQNTVALSAVTNRQNQKHGGHRENKGKARNANAVHAPQNCHSGAQSSTLGSTQNVWRSQGILEHALEGGTCRS